MTSDVRPLTADDLDWIVELSRVRRETLPAHAPRFWRPAADATARHRAFLAHLIADDTTLAVRTDHGFLLAVGDGSRRVVDDVVVGGDVGASGASGADGDAWADEGVALLRVVLEQTAAVRVVVPDHEAGRRAAVESVGLVPAEVWWHRDLPLVQVRREGEKVRLTTDGAAGHLVPAPPVYDPGGSVLLVTEVATAAALAAIEAEAAERGATVSVVTQRPDDLMRELILVEAGHVRTTTFFESIAT